MRRNVTGDNVCKALKAAADLLRYPDLRNIDIEQVDTHSLRGGEAKAQHPPFYFSTDHAR